MVNLSGPVGLFIPCYVDQFYPEVGKATLFLLEKLGCQVVYPEAQTCCGQPFANAGYLEKSNPLHELFRNNFDKFEYIVCPSGSCTHYVMEHALTHGKKKVYELIEFLYDILGIRTISSAFPYRVGLHQSCHGLRGLKLAASSELNIPYFNKTKELLSTVEGIELVDLKYPDECCGFGGTFAVNEEALSVKMGKDRIRDHEENHVEIIAGNDMSCLMHLEGLLRRSKSKIRVCHVAEILNGEMI